MEVNDDFPLERFDVVVQQLRDADDMLQLFMDEHITSSDEEEEEDEVPFE